MELRGFIIKDSFELTDVRVFLIIFFIGFFLYIHTLSYDLIYLDDDMLLKGNVEFLEMVKNRELSLVDIFRTHIMSTKFGYSYYRPLLNLSFVLNYMIDNTVFTFRLVNVLLHIANSFLLYLLIKKFGLNIVNAFILSLFFLVHPTVMTSVVWLPGRNDLMLSFFVLIFLFFFLRYTETFRLIYLVITSFAFMLSVFTKETAVMIIPLVVFYIWLNDYNFKKILPLIISLFSVFLFWFAIRYICVENYIFPTFSNFRDGMKSLFFMLSKIFLPLGIELRCHSYSDLDYKLGFPICAFILVVLYSCIKEKRKNAIFGIFLSFVFILPFVLFNLPASWDQRLVVPIIGFIIFISGLRFAFIDKLSIFLKGAFLLLFFVLFFISSLVYSTVLENKFTFWEYVVERHPEDVEAYIILAGFYKQIESDYAKGLYNKIKNMNFTL